MKEFEMAFWQEVFLHALRTGQPIPAAGLNADTALEMFRKAAADAPNKAPQRFGSVK